MVDVPPSKIDTTPIETGGQSTVPVGNDPFTRDPIIDQKLGLVGKFFGYGEEKKGNIAGIVLLFAVIMLTVCFSGQFFASTEEARAALSSFVTPLFGLLTGLVGYVTGKKSDD